MSNPTQNITCNDIRYVRELTVALKSAYERKDIERAVQLASELERYKVLCGNVQVIRDFEESLKRYSKELDIQDVPEISRAINGFDTTEKKLYTMRNFEIYEINEDGTLSTPQEGEE